jgi:hypothetical protein
MSAAPTPAELRRRLRALAANVDTVPEHRRAHALVLLERLEQLTDDDGRVWSY